jgi:cell division protein FtsQ
MSGWHPSMGVAKPVPRRAPMRSKSPGIRSWISTALGVAVMLAAAFWVTRSAVFQARELSVSGNNRLSARQVLRLAGLGKETNVLWFSSGRAEAKLLSSPWIQSARIERALPMKIVVRVVERTPAAILSGGSRMLVASDGTVLSRAPASWRLTVIPVGDVALRIGTRPVIARAELAVLRSLPRTIRSRVLEAKEERGQLVLELRGDVRAIYGDASEAAAKSQALAAVLEWASRKGIGLSAVDVRAPVTPAAIPVGESIPVTPSGPITLQGPSGGAAPSTPGPKATPTPAR